MIRIRSLRGIAAMAGCMLLGWCLTVSQLGAQEPKTSTADVGTPKVLPRPDFEFKGKVGKTYKDSDPPQFPQPVKAPKGGSERGAHPAG